MLPIYLRPGRQGIVAGLALWLLVLLPIHVSWGQEVAFKTLTINVSAPVFLYLQVGSRGGIVDQVNFNVTEPPGSGPVRGESTGAYPVPVLALGLLSAPGMVALTANSSQPLTSAEGRQIPFSQIYWNGSHDMPSGRFDGGAQQVVFSRAVPLGAFFFHGTWAFFYDNKHYFPTAQYRGQIVYTLGMP